MKLRRMLAAVLCLAMIATSGATANIVGATEVGEQPEVISTDAKDVDVPAAEEKAVFEEANVNVPEEVTDVTVGEEEEVIVVEETEESSDDTSDGASDEFLEKPDTPTAAFSVVGGVLTFDPSKWNEDDSVLIDLPGGDTKIPVGLFNSEPYSGTSGNDDLAMVKDVFFTGSGTVTIEDGAFYCNKLITNVDGTRVGTVGNSAFYNCSSLNGFDLKNVTSIGNDAFSSSTLIVADLSSAVTIGNRAFSACSSLSNITWGNEITTIGDSAFNGCKFSTLKIDHLYDLDETGIGIGAFSNNASLTNVTLPYQLAEIPQLAFAKCTSLNAVNLSKTDRYGNVVDNGLYAISAKAFEGCTSLKEISLEKNVISVGSQAFADCSALVSISFLEQEGRVEIDTTALPDRSNEKVKGVIRGRGGKVKEFAEKIVDTGWTYKDLDLYKIKITNPKGGKITSSVASAGEGEKVFLTTTPDSGYTFTSIMINGVPLEAQPDKDLYSASPTKQVYLIRMPGKDIEVTAVTAKTSEVFKGNDLMWTFSPNSYGGTNSDALKFTQAGNSVKISVFNKLNGNPIDLWNFKMSTTDGSIVTISQFGEISALKKGSGNILLEPTVSSAKKIAINVTVANNATIETLDFDEYFEKVKDGDIKIEDARIIDKDDDLNTTGYYIVEFDVESIAKAEHKFSPTLTATDTEGTTLLVNSKWETKDKNVATVGSATSSLNENTITVVKGSLGESFIKVTTINDDDGSEVEGGFIVRVLDTAPRLIKKSVQVNVKSGGSPLLTRPVYGYTISSYSLKVCTKKSNKGVITYPENNAGFNARYDRDRGQIILSVSNVSGKYKPQTQTKVTGLYIEGTQKREGSTTPVTFHMPIDQVVVINDNIVTDLGYSGKINLLYDENYEKARSNVVTVSLGVENVSGLEIERVDLVTNENYKKSKTAVPADDEFASNFEVDLSRPVTDKNGFSTGFIVKVKDGIADDKDFKKDSNGIIASGKAKIKFYSYPDTVDVSIKIPCAYTYPNYALSAKKATASVYFKNPAYLVQIIDNDSKPKRGVELYTTQDGKRIPKAVVMSNDLGASGTTPSNFFNDPVLDHSEPELDANDEYVYDEITGKQIFDDFIRLSGNGTPRVGKERFNFRLPGWRRSMQFNFNLDVSNSRVSGKLNPSSLSMSRQIKTQTAKMEFSFNFKEAKAVGCAYSYKWSAKTADAYEELKNAFEFVEEAKNEKGRVIPAHIKVDLSNCDIDEIPKGTYSFTATPEVKVGEYDVPSNESPNIGFKISLSNSNIKLSLVKNKFSLNTNYSGNGEIATVGTKVSGLAKGSSYVLDEDALDDIHLQAVSPKNIPEDWSGDTPEYGEDKKTIEGWDDGNWRDKIKFSVCEDKNKNKVLLGVELDESVPDSAFNYDYYIYDLPFKVGDDQLLQNKVKIRISGHRKFETVSLSSKNTFNQIITGKYSPVNEKVVVPGYEMVYSYSIKNLNGTIDEVELREIDSRSNTYYDDESPHFYVPDDGIDNDKKTITILLNQDNIMGSDDDEIAPIKSGESYLVDVYYHIKECGDEWAQTPCRIKIVPKQVLPSLKQVVDSKTMYVGDEDRYFEFEVGKTTCQNAVFADAPPEDVTDTVGVKEYIKIADTAKEDIRRAFRVVEVEKDVELREWNSRTKDFTGASILDKNKDKILGARIKVELVQPSYLVGGKNGRSYTIPIEVRYENQDKDTKGTIVNFNVTFVK